MLEELFVYAVLLAISLPMQCDSEMNHAKQMVMHHGIIT